MNYAITTFGCKVNQYESSGLSELMNRRGFFVTDKPEETDIHIINSCTVTGNSDRKVRQLVSRIRKNNPHTLIILCGCFPKAFPEKAELIGADVVFPGIWKGEDLPFSPQLNRTRAFLKIEDGCNHSCAYCIIPKARGRVRSRPLPEIIAEAEQLVRHGHKEIVITGINLAAYGTDTGSSLVQAVEAVCNIPDIQRVRLSSLEPDLITEPDILRLSKLSKLCPHFHLSLQSGSDTVLKRMNRNYNTEYYRNIVKLFREHFPNCAITTDIIVGFPGETEQEFAETLAFAEEMQFAKIHSFAFSKREGTAAAEMPEQVSNTIKRERVARLCGLAERLRSRHFTGLVGTVQEVLLESENTGHTRDYTPVKISGKFNKNDIIKVKIVKATKEYCKGEI
ncbi:MAG: MiaB/RimO family radical SAM methylthiotransferase [Oscillospiraceae bacterium]|nr:MiaB/RimO family radical SAM methylthiotransferase [Oscillospiraceae bacterium]